MFPELKGKILFVFSDPGGAKPLLALAEKHPDSIVVSDREHPFYKDFKVQVHIADSNYEKIINQHAPHMVVTGTSYRSDIEKKFHRLCVQTHTPCYAFIDHWTSMRVRFEQPDGSLLIPDNVCVIDERAKNLAVSEGIDVSKILITGNPYHLWLSEWKPRIQKQNFLKLLGDDIINKKIILFAPDPLSNISGMEKFGFDEALVTREIVNYISIDINIRSKWVMLVRLHPNQDRNVIAPLIENNNFFKILEPESDLNTCIYYSDIVLGFYSSLLIEATIMNKKVVRYIAQSKSNDPLAPFNDLKIISSINKLKNELFN